MHLHTLPAMTTLFVLLVMLLVHVAGRSWFAYVKAGSTTLSACLDPRKAALSMLQENGIFVPVQAGGSDTYYHLRSEHVVLSNCVSRRRDVEAVSVAMHEAAHAIQHRRYGMEMLFVATMGPAFILFFCILGITWREHANLFAFLMIAMAIFRAGIEIDAWFIAQETLRQWRMQYRIPWQMIVSSVLSYL